MLKSGLVALPPWIAPISLYQMPYWLPGINDDIWKEHAELNSWTEYPMERWTQAVCIRKTAEYEQAMVAANGRMVGTEVMSDGCLFAHYALSHLLLDRHTTVARRSQRQQAPPKVKLIATLLLRQQQEKIDAERAAAKQAAEEENVTEESLKLAEESKNPRSVFLSPRHKAHVRQVEIAKAMARDAHKVYNNGARPLIACMSLNDIRCNKYIVQHARGLKLDTVLPTGHTVAWFAMQWFAEHRKRHSLHRKKRNLKKRQLRDLKRARPSMTQRRRQQAALAAASSGETALMDAEASFVSLAVSPCERPGKRPCQKSSP